MNRGFTLLEIILSLAILAGSLAALGEVIRLADLNSSMGGDETQAQIIASTVMDELISGYRPAEAVNRAVYDETMDAPWVYSVSIEQTAYEELVAVRVLVEQQTESQLQPVRFELVRWLPNPDFTPAETGEESTGGSTNSGSSSNSSTSGSSTQSGGSP